MMEICEKPQRRYTYCGRYIYCAHCMYCVMGAPSVLCCVMRCLFISWCVISCVLFPPCTLFFVLHPVLYVSCFKTLFMPFALFLMSVFVFSWCCFYCLLKSVRVLCPVCCGYLLFTVHTCHLICSFNSVCVLHYFLVFCPYVLCTFQCLVSVV
jgi:hypothetical protein